MEYRSGKRDNFNHLSYFGTDPGAVKHGNFINYYAFHSTDERIKNLNSAMFPEPTDKPYLCLDIGCNTGVLTDKLYLYLKKLYPNSKTNILAIDIDETLIERAKERNTNPDIIYTSLNMMDEKDCEKIKNYLNSFDKELFDVVFCFSVTMWIHLNHGDNGLLNFLKCMKSISKSIIIETQPWKCYRSAQRRLKKSGEDFPMYHLLKIRGNVNDIIKTKLSETPHKNIFESQNSSWERKIQNFQI